MIKIKHYDNNQYVIIYRTSSKKHGQIAFYGTKLELKQEVERIVHVKFDNIKPEITMDGYPWI